MFVCSLVYYVMFVWKISLMKTSARTDSSYMDSVANNTSPLPLPGSSRARGDLCFSNGLSFRN